MSTDDLIIELYCRIDDKLKTIENHAQSKFSASELVTMGMLFSIKGVGQRAFYRWIERDYKDWFPHLPERSRLFRRLKTRWYWAQHFLAAPSLLGIIDSYGVELIHPRRNNRHANAWRSAGISNHRWIVGCKWCLVINQLGQIIRWAWSPAHAHDTWFHPFIAAFKDQSIIFADSGFHAKQGNPDNMKLCPRGQWNDRMLIETVYSMLSVVCHTKKMRHRVDHYFQAHLGFMVAAFNTLVSWFGLLPREDGFVPLSISLFSL